jgi:hypothetical protein
MELSSASFLGLRSHASSLSTALALLRLPELRKGELMVRTLEEVNVERIRSLTAGIGESVCEVREIRDNWDMITVLVKGCGGRNSRGR